MIHLDTHVVAWLYEGRSELFPVAVANLLEENDLVISPMVELELEYLHEIGRALVTGHAVVEDLRGRIGLTRCQAPFATVIEQARGLGWTRDPFDRIIVATALADGARLVTRDSTIRSHYDQACWEAPAAARRRPRKPRAK